jgi:hypothetical protein
MIKLTRYIILLFILFPLIGYNQCVGVQSFTLTPPPPTGGYTPGTSVTVCYKMIGWSGLSVGSNWLEGFDINLGSGWTNLTWNGTGLGPPANCQGGSGNWVWLTTNNTPSGTIGPGWFFDSGISGTGNNNIASDDWGDQGNCTWQFCFKVKVVNTCDPLSLLIQVTAGADGDWGNWINNSCPTTPFTIYNGTINNNLPSIGSMSHN